MYMWCNIRRHPLTVLLPTRTSTRRCTNTIEWMGRETAWVTGAGNATSGTTPSFAWCGVCRYASRGTVSNGKVILEKARGSRLYAHDGLGVRHIEWVTLGHLRKRSQGTQRFTMPSTPLNPSPQGRAVLLAPTTVTIHAYHHSSSQASTHPVDHRCICPLHPGRTTTSCEFSMEGGVN